MTKRYEVEVQRAASGEWFALRELPENTPWSAGNLQAAKKMRGLLRLTGKPARIVRVLPGGIREVVE